MLEIIDLVTKRIKKYCGENNADIETGAPM
jgi:hypothetical protein